MKYESDGGGMVGEFVCVCVCMCMHRWVSEGVSEWCECGVCVSEWVSRWRPRDARAYIRHWWNKHAQTPCPALLQNRIRIITTCQSRMQKNAYVRLTWNYVKITWVILHRNGRNLEPTIHQCSIMSAVLHFLRHVAFFENNFWKSISEIIIFPSSWKRPFDTCV